MFVIAPLKSTINLRDVWMTNLESELCSTWLSKGALQMLGRKLQ